jgi:hypothetical protein
MQFGNEEGAGKGDASFCGLIEKIDFLIVFMGIF